VLGLAVPSLIPGHDPIGIAQRLDLRREHRVVHQQAVTEHHNREIASRVRDTDGGSG
jgi:hypothetical protein